MTRPLGIELGAEPPLAHYAASVDTVAWLPAARAAQERPSRRAPVAAVASRQMDWGTLGAMAVIVFGALGLQSFWVAREFDAANASSSQSRRGSIGLETRLDARFAEIRATLDRIESAVSGSIAASRASKSACDRQPAIAAPVPASSWPNFARFDVLADARLRDQLVVLDQDVPAEQHDVGRADHVGVLVEVVVDARVVRRPRGS